MGLSNADRRELYERGEAIVVAMAAAAACCVCVEEEGDGGAVVYLEPFVLLYLLPLIRRRLPEARLPMESPGMGAALAGSAVLAQVIRRTRLHPAAVEVVARPGAALVPAMMALRGSRIAGYHGAEHKAIGGYEHDGGAHRGIAEGHERCGSHMVGPLIAAHGQPETSSSRACPPRAAARPGWWQASPRWAPRARPSPG